MTQARLKETPESAQSATMPMFGWRIRTLRRKTGLTLQALADQAGISVGFLSQVERDKATPSLGTLASLAAALDIDLDRFVATPKPADGVTRAGDRPAFALADGSLRYERLTTELAGGAFTSLIVHLPVGYASEIVSHAGEEMVLVLEGTVRKTLGNATFILNVGDSMHFMGDTPHSFANVGDCPARMSWTGTSPRLLRRISDSKSIPPADSRTHNSAEGE